MYGWISTGGAIDKYFHNSKPFDVVMRTAYIDNSLIFGNSNAPDAAMYISSNIIGIKGPPDPNFVVSVNGNIKTNDSISCISTCASNLQQTVLSSSNLQLSFNQINNTTISSFGMIQNKLIISEHLYYVTSTLNGILILSVFPNVFFDSDMTSWNGFTMTLEQGLYNELEEDSLISINRTPFKIINVSSGLVTTVDFVNYFTAQPLNFNSNDIVQIDILSNSKAENLMDFYINIPFKILDFSFPDNTDTAIQLVISIDDLKNIGFLVLGRLFNIRLLITTKSLAKPIDNVFILKDITVVDPNLPRILLITLRTISNRTGVSVMANTFINAFFGSPLRAYLFTVDTIYDYQYLNTDVGVNWGFFISSTGERYVELKNTNIKSNSYALNLKSIDSFTYNNTLSYSVEYNFQYNNAILLKLKDLDTNFLFAIQNGTISYSYIGNTLVVVSGRYLDERTLELTCENTNFIYQITKYIGSYIYIIDHNNDSIYRLDSITDTSNPDINVVIVLTTDINHSFNLLDTDLTSARYVFVFPLKLYKILLIGSLSNNAYVPNSLGIGTNDITEKLSVQGNIAVENSIVFNDLASHQKFVTKFSSNVYDINSSIFVSSNVLTVNLDTIFESEVTAANFKSFSDTRLKQNIQLSDPFEDLSQILRLDIKSFNFKDTPHHFKKGVLAQQIKKILPQTVSSYYGFLPSIYKYGFIINNNLYLTLSREKQRHIKPGLLIRIGSKDVEIVRVTKHAKYIKIALYDKYLQQGKVFVYGTKEAYLTVDHDYLFMMGINSIKALQYEIDTIKQKIVNNK